MRAEALVSSIRGEFEQYTIENVVTVSYGRKTIILTYIDKQENTVTTTKYSSNDVLIVIG